MNNAVSREVAFYHNPKADFYPKQPPYSPSEAYPEYPFKELGEERNVAYESVRNLFKELGYDKENFGKKGWNPLKDLVKPGDRVLIKPNYVREKPYKGGDQDALITHGSIIRAVADYVMIALQGRGTLIVGDAPLQSSDFEKILFATGIPAIKQFYRAHDGTVPVQHADFRVEKADKTVGSFIWRYRVQGGPEDWIRVELGEESALDAPEVPQDRLRAPNYDRKRMREQHRPGHHEYLINHHVLEADVVLNLSKLKTHRIGGITCSMKNLVGLLAHKSCLAHYSSGSIPEGGDEYSQPSWVKKTFYTFMEWEDNTRNILKRFFIFWPRMFFHFLAKKTTDRIYEGNWHKNDTLWRMIIDLNKIVLFADSKGKMRPTQQRRYFCLVDGIVAGEKNGPMMPTNKPLGVLIGGLNPVAVDYVCNEVMGFRMETIPSLDRAWHCTDHKLAEFGPDDVEVLPKGTILPNFHFIPHKNWIGDIEKEPGYTKGKATPSSDLDEDLEFR